MLVTFSYVRHKRVIKGLVVLDIEHLLQPFLFLLHPFCEQLGSDLGLQVVQITLGIIVLFGCFTVLLAQGLRCVSLLVRIDQPRPGR